MNHSNAYSVHQQLLDAVSFSKKSYILTGKILRDLKYNDNFKEAVGDGIDTWSDYLSQPEVGMNVSEANRLIQIYEVFVQKLGFDEDYLSQIPVKNLHYVLPIAKEMDTDDNVDDLLEEARTLSQKDFKERLYDRKNDDGERTYEFLVMKRCNETGSLSRVHGIDSEQIKNTFELDETK